MALAQPPALKAMVPFVAATDPGRYGNGHNGAFELRFFTWLFTVGNERNSSRGEDSSHDSRVVFLRSCCPIF